METEICANPAADRIFWSGPSSSILLVPGSNSTHPIHGDYNSENQPKFQALPLTHRRTDTTACETSVLVLTNASLSDSGLYILVARNTYHITEARFELDVGSNLIKAAFSESVDEDDFENILDEEVKVISQQDTLISDTNRNYSVENKVESIQIEYTILLLLLIVPRAF